MKKIFTLILVAVISTLTLSSAAGKTATMQTMEQQATVMQSVEQMGADIMSVTFTVTPLGNGQYKVQGTIYDEYGDPYPGVTVTYSGSILGTVTDINGDFTIIVPNLSVLLLIHILGYATIGIPLV